MTHRDALRDARHALARLAAAERAYFDGQPYRLLHRYDPRAGTYTVQAEVTRRIPADVPALAASVLRLAVTALGELMRALTSVAGAVEVRFPIHDTLPQFAQRSRRALAGIPDTAQATIEELQPYHRLGGFRHDPLWLLRELDAAGEPRTAAGSVRPDATLGVNTKRDVEIVGELRARAGSFEHGAIIVSVAATGAGADPKLEVFFRPGFELAFAKGEPARGALLVGTLGAICDHVEQAVFARLEPCLRG